MAKKINIQKFEHSWEERWDNFILDSSVNGTILQTRRFLNYHPKDRFDDDSLMFMKGNNIVAVMPGNYVTTDGKKKYISHSGSTFGGLIISHDLLKLSVLEEIYSLVDDYCYNNNYSEVRLKMTSYLYSGHNFELLDYFFFNKGYTESLEVGYYIDFNSYNEDIISNFSSSVRRHYRKSLSNGLVFKEVFDKEGIGDFYKVLLDNYKKFNDSPVHTFEELIKLKKDILQDDLHFYCVYYGNIPVASSMVFSFGKRVFHTQYLASVLDYSDMYVNEFLYKNLIVCAKNDGYKYLSFGTATLENGRVLNYNLAQYKEQYGTDKYVNRTYYKSYK